jgi:uncharacterized membrane-anchored protein
MSRIADEIVTKVPAVTLGFWIIKIAATTLGETGGDTVTMSMSLGYLIGTAIFLAILVGLIAFQIAARKFHPVLYWATIVASTKGRGLSCFNRDWILPPHLAGLCFRCLAYFPNLTLQ